MSRFLPSSMRWSLQLWQGLVLLLVLAACGLMAWNWQWTQAVAAVDANLQKPALLLLGQMRGPGPPRPPRPNRPPGPPKAEDDRPPPPDFARPEGGPPDSELDLEEDLPPNPVRRGRAQQELALWVNETTAGAGYYRAWNAEGELLFRAGSPVVKVERPNASFLAVMPHMQPTYRDVSLADGPARELLHLNPEGSVVLIGHSMLAEAQQARKLGWNLAALAASIWALAFLGGGWLIRRALRPVQEISKTATALAAGDWERRIDLPESGSELGQLAEVLNKTFSQLQQSYDQQARFTADAAHELRTPVSVLLSQTQLSLSRNREAPEYRQALETCRRAGLRMKALTEALLQLSRLDAGAECMAQDDVDLATVAKECLAWLNDGESPMAVVKHEGTAAKCRGDARLLSQIITNLAQNAQHHSPAELVVTLRTSMVGNLATLEVIDHGAGISAEHLPHLFERFYRADASRTRITERGAGLGLAIAKMIAEAHAGKLTVQSEDGKGSTFTLAIPAVA